MTRARTHERNNVTYATAKKQYGNGRRLFPIRGGRTDARAPTEE